jgi:hypothetical protein
MFVAGSLGWAVAVDWFRPDRYDIIGDVDEELVPADRRRRRRLRATVLRRGHRPEWTSLQRVDHVPTAASTEPDADWRAVSNGTRSKMNRM